MGLGEFPVRKTFSLERQISCLTRPHKTLERGFVGALSNPNRLRERLDFMSGQDYDGKTQLEHDPEKLTDFSDKIMRQNKEKESAIDSRRSNRALMTRQANELEMAP